MYFHRKHSKTSRCLQLLEAYRPIGGVNPRHRVVASLGDAEIPEEWFDGLAALIESRLTGSALLLPPELPPEGLEWVNRIVEQIRCKREEERKVPGETLDGVLVDQVDHSHSTVLGPLVVGLHAWKKLGMDGVLNALGFNTAQRQAACALILGRLAEPMSEHAFYHWLPQSSFPDIFGPDVCSGGAQRYYRVGDKLLEQRAPVEAAIRDRIGKHFGLKRTVFLYDLTNFHFEGACEANRMAVRGRNKQKRNDCPQVVIGVVFDEFGFEVLHRTFAGNRSDCKTLPEMVQALHRASAEDHLVAPEPPTVVVDGGLATKANLAELRKLGFHYLVNDKRARRKTWLDLFRQNGFSPVAGRSESLEVLVKHVDLDRDDIHGLEVDERIVLCKSRGRRNKELAIRSRAEERFLKDMEALSKRLAAGGLKTCAAADRALGRALGKHPRVARFYQASVLKTSTLTLTWERDDQRWGDEDEMAGCYALRTDRHDLEGQELWRLYMTLCRAEDGFQTVKSDLGLRPAFHQVEHRVNAHVFITVLAYQILRFILHTLESQGDTRSWYTLRHVLATHCYATVHLPLENGTVHRLRKPGRPEECQWDIYRKLGINTMSHLPSSRTAQSAKTQEKSPVEAKKSVVT